MMDQGVRVRTDDEVEQDVVELDPVTASVVSKKDAEIAVLKERVEDERRAAVEHGRSYDTALANQKANYDERKRDHERALADAKAFYSGRRPFLWLYLLCVVSGWVGGVVLAVYSILNFARHRLTSDEAVPLTLLAVAIMLCCYITAGVEAGSK
jgi:hypothetical protein